ncbi:hypothetical protein [Ramlibacter sp. WS9]|uniref:hypothetical protein n=1 Tax=Ramlibacter sp. WS9 TaxID=1882741 RepID=UPI0011451492|nr:hypothetical protein [Ramlibacter sp. WS9]
MTGFPPTVQSFTEAADSWLCDGCSLVVRYMALAESDINRIIDAQLLFQPLPASRSIDFHTRAGDLVAGQKSFSSLRKTELKSRLADAIGGRITLGKQKLALDDTGPSSFHSEMPVRDRWFFNLHLQMWGKALPLKGLSSIPESSITFHSACPRSPAGGH